MYFFYNRVFSELIQNLYKIYSRHNNKSTNCARVLVIRPDEIRLNPISTYIFLVYVYMVMKHLAYSIVRSEQQVPSDRVTQEMVMVLSNYKTNRSSSGCYRGPQWSCAPYLEHYVIKLYCLREQLPFVREVSTPLSVDALSNGGGSSSSVSRQS